MKSIQTEGAISCPNHCEEFDAEYWTFVSGDDNPELKEAILGGELNLFRCPSCDTFFHYEGTVVYYERSLDLLVFVFPHAQKEKEQELVAKMQRDYDAIKNTVLKDMPYPPIYVFGLEGLKEVLLKEQERSFESEAVAAACAAAGYPIVRLRPGYARKEGFPLYVPAAPSATANDFAVAACKVLKSGLKSPLLQNFMDKMSEGGAQAPVIL